MDDEKELLAWKEAHADVYSKFKEDLECQLQKPYHQIVMDMSKGMEAEPLRSVMAFFALLMTKSEADIERFFSKYIEREDPVVMCFWCYCTFDNGIERLAKTFEEKTEEPDMKEIMDFLGDGKPLFNLDKPEAAEKLKDDELNLLALRRWHYDHPEEYAQFVATFQKAYDGDMTFITTNFRILMEMLSFDGVQDMMQNVASLVPGTKPYELHLQSADDNQLKKRMSEILDSSINNESVRQQLLLQNPHLFCLYYWLVFDSGFLHAADLISKTFLKDTSPIWQRQIGQKAVEALISASIDKAHYSKAQWTEVAKKLKKGKVRQIIHSALLEEKGKRGRKNTVALLEEMLPPEQTPLLIGEIEKILSQWKQKNETDSILAYIFAALVQGGFTATDYNYRTFHSAMREKYPEFNFKKGYDWAEANYNAIMSEDVDGNLSVSYDQTVQGRKYATDIKLRLLSLFNPNIN